MNSLPVSEIPAVYENLLRTAMIRCRNDEERARDMVQQTFTKALRYEFDPSRSSFNTWMHHILFSLIADDKKRRSKHIEKDVAPLKEDLTTSRCWRNELEEVETKDHIDTLFRRLPATSRAHLQDMLDGFSAQEVADRLDVSRALVNYYRRDIKSKFMELIGVEPC